MKISKPNKLLKAVSYSFFSLLAGFYLIGGFYSLQEPTESVWENHTHTSLSFHSNHSHFPLNFFSALISESVEETEDDVHESKPVAVQVSESFFPLPAYNIPLKQVALPSLRQAVLNRPSVLLFILHHSWKSFLS